MEDYGQCFKCQRIVPMEFLEGVRFFDGHKVEGSFHHQLICLTCKKKADMIFESGEKK